MTGLVPGTKKLVLPVVAAAILLASAIINPTVLSSGSSTARAAKQFRRDRNLILLRRGEVNTLERRDLDTSGVDSRLTNELTTAGASEHRMLRLIQFAEPITTHGLEAIEQTGAEIVCFVPNNACVIRGAARAIAQLAPMERADAQDNRARIQWMGRLEPIQKIDPAFSVEALEQSRENAQVEIELIASEDTDASLATIINLASVVNRQPRRFQKFIVVSVTLPIGKLMEIAQSERVLFIGPESEYSLQDERAAQIVAGNVDAVGAQPAGPGYLDWLASHQINGRADFVIDIADTGMDRGLTLDDAVHPDFRDSEGHSRVVYSLNYANDGQTDDRLGHGSICASAAAGLGMSDRKDSAGYRFGLGVDPWALLGASRIFDHFGRLPSRISFTEVVDAAYSRGARISNNSWGDGGNAYDTVAQEYDSLVRDAQPTASGNQEMTFVFAVGNGGPGGHVSSPGTAKNVITVAASENFRPEGLDSCNLDGAGGIGPDGADNATDILRYSAGGPTADGRAKPDITAPGTHVYGAASQSQFFRGDGLCPGIPVYQPPGQSLYTWSSGTSLATPHIAGAAALLRTVLVTQTTLEGRPPSPAMIKALLINSSSYLDGANAGGDLPSDRQGWGLANVERAFADAPRKLIDQSRLFTESGQSFEVEGSLFDRSKPLRVTLVWTDAAGSPIAGNVLVNNLDLEVSIGAEIVYRGNNFSGQFSVGGGEADALNNVESVYLPPDAIPAGYAGNFKITVRATSLGGDGVPGNDNPLDQDFALVVTNITTPVPPPPPPNKVPVIVAATYEGKTLTITGHDFTGSARVEINGKIIEKEFTFDATANSLTRRLKRKKLNLTENADNQIVLIEKGERSAPFTLRL